MKPFRYRIIVEWSDEDEAFIARIPAFSGCAAHGDSPEDAAREARIAAQGVLESLKLHGDSIPPEDVVADFSGQLRLRLPSSLHERLARLAAAEGVSLNQELVALLAEGCGVKKETAAKKDIQSGKGKGRKRAA